MRTLSSLLLAIVFCGCADALVSPKIDSSPPTVFNELWNEFNIRYPNFDARHVDWEAQRARFASRVTPSMPDTDLILTLDSLLLPLHDGHVGLNPTVQWPRNAHLRYETTDSAVEFDVHSVSSYFLIETANISSSGRLIFGRIQDSIGYIHVSDFETISNSWSGEVDSVLATMWNAAAIIIDVRGNQGGSALAAQQLASRFIASPAIYDYTQERVDAASTNLSAPLPNWIYPRGDVWKKRVVLLTDHSTMSAAEWFTLQIKTQPNVTSFGDTTQGAFSSRLDRELSNGWTYSMSYQKVTDAGHVCHEGVGIVPDFEIYVKYGQRVFSRDSVLDRAVEFLKK